MLGLPVLIRPDARDADRYEVEVYGRVIAYDLVSLDEVAEAVEPYVGLPVEAECNGEAITLDRGAPR